MKNGEALGPQGIARRTGLCRHRLVRICGGTGIAIQHQFMRRYAAIDHRTGGVPLMPFLHADLKHLLSNTVPLTILLLLLAGSKANSWTIVAFIVFMSGAMLWLFGRPATHVGASGLIFGLIAFLLASGILERRIVPLVISIVVGFLYGGTLLSGIVPDLGSHISWEGHLFGAIAGGLAAGLMTKRGVQPEDHSS